MSSEHPSVVYPSGAQFPISHGNHAATIVEVGGGVREYAVGDRPVLDPYPLDSMCDGAHGTVLVPWPNRLANGRYQFDGVDYQVALTEPRKSNAIHGFLRWRSWDAVDHSASRVVMTTVLHPLSGYPFHLKVSVEYELDDAGLTVTTTATNLGTSTLPYGCGQHPYLSPGTGLIDDCLLELGAATRILTDNERQLPSGTEPVPDSPFDFATPRQIEGLQLDYPFTDLTRDDRGRALVRLTGIDGNRVEMWVDESYPILELYTGDTLTADRRRRGLGAEPMTCPPNAFQSGDGLVRLEPGASMTTQWGVTLIPCGDNAAMSGSR
jgi:aldose 1-epimerase